MLEESMKWKGYHDFMLDTFVKTSSESHRLSLAYHVTFVNFKLRFTNQDIDVSGIVTISEPPSSLACNFILGGQGHIHFPLEKLYSLLGNHWKGNKAKTP